MDGATGETEPRPEEPAKDPQPSSLADGGFKGGKARAKKLSAKKRSEIARKAARARWNSADLRPP